MKRFMYVFVLIFNLIVSSVAQEQTIYLTAALPSNLGLTDDVFAEFEAAHPNVEVIRVDAAMPNRISDQEHYFDELEKYASSADLLYFRSYTLTPEATEAGFLLDLAPLAMIGKDEQNFHRAAWDSFQWDGGFWALPLDFTLGVLSYDPVAFDAAGLSYPNEQWTLTDIANAARSVGRLNVSGGSASLLRSLLGENLFGESTLPHSPRLTGERANVLLETWNVMIGESLVNSLPMGEGRVDGWGITPLAEAESAVLLPGGHAGMLFINGLAISAGTAQPELAYALAQYLTTRQEMVAIYGDSVIPARHNGAYVPDDSLTSRAIDHALSYSELRYFDAFLGALPITSNTATALAEAEADVRSSQQAALTHRATLTLSVNTPPVPDSATAGEAVIHFGLLSYMTPLPNQADWEAMAITFAEADSQVSAVEFSTFANFTADAIRQNQYDCFFAPFAPSVVEPGILLDLTPLMNADPAFIEDDFLPGVLSAASVNHRILGYPLTFRPAMLTVQNGSGITPPDRDWTFNDFVDVLHTSPTQPALGTNNVIGTHLLLLIAANGGLPIDYRTDPPTLNFVGSADAIRGVLDLARDGYLFYRPQWVEGVAPLNQSFAPIMTTVSDTFFTDVDTTAILYPQGSDYLPMAFGIGAGYITRTTANPEACYRWISMISERPDLFVAAMPTRHSTLNSTLLLAAQGDQLVSRYTEIASQLESSSAILFPSPLYGNGTIQNFYLEEILYRAFDQYVQGSPDLDGIMTETEDTAWLYLNCTASIALFEEGQDYNAYTQQFEHCASTAKGE